MATCSLYSIYYTIEGYSLKFENDFGDVQTGYVMIGIDDTWGLVCSRLWTEVEAAVACRQKGYSYGTINPKVRTICRGELCFHQLKSHIEKTHVTPI